MQADLTIQCNDARPGSGRGVLICLLFAAAAGLLAWTLAGQAGREELSLEEAWQVVAPADVGPAGEAAADDVRAWDDFAPASLGVLGVIVDPEYGHGDARHPDEAPQVRDCLSRRGAYRNFLVSKEMRRYLRVCLMPDGRFGFQILDKIGEDFWEVTAYIRRDLRTPAELQRYIDYVRYTRFKGVIQ